MKNYNPNITNGVHTVMITLQSWGYKGHIFQKITGNCKGRDMLHFDFYEEDEFPDNDCQLEYDEDVDYFSCVLKDDEGNTIECEGDASEMNDMIVAVEIIDFSEVEEQHDLC